MPNKKPIVKYFNVFGVKCYMLKDGSENIEKFDAKSNESVFLGYSLESSRKVVKSLSVTFDQTKHPSIKKEDTSHFLDIEERRSF